MRSAPQPCCQYPLTFVALLCLNSLAENYVGPKLGEYISAALKVNKTLTSIKYAIQHTLPACPFSLSIPFDKNPSLCMQLGEKQPDRRWHVGRHPARRVAQSEQLFDEPLVRAAQPELQPKVSIPFNILPILPASDTCLVCATACKATTWTKPPSSNSKELLAAASPCGSKLSPCAAASSAGAPS